MRKKLHKNIYTKKITKYLITFLITNKTLLQEMKIIKKTMILIEPIR